MKRVLAGVMILSLSVLMLTACGPEKNVASTPTSDATADASKFIGEDKAKELALKKADIGADDVRFDRVELDRDDGVWKYEMDFRHGDMEYDIDVNAETGEILSYEKEKETGF